MPVMLWFDRAGLDNDAYESLGREVGHARPRVLAWATTSDGVVVGLPDRLAVRSGEDWTQVPWSDVVSGGWDNQASALTWRLLDGTTGRAQIEEPGRLPELFRERVTASIVVSEHVDIPGTARGVTVTARRNPSAPRSPLSWVAVPARGTDLSAPGVQAAADAAVARVKADYDIG